MKQNPSWPSDLKAAIEEGTPLTWPQDWSNEQGQCIKCAHHPTDHHIVKGGDGIYRIFCQSCPPSRMILMGEEKAFGPCPFFIEGPLGSIACFEERIAVQKVDNYLPLSPESKNLMCTLTLQATTPDGKSQESITFTGLSWHPSEFECLKNGDEVDKKSNRYKLHLYWLQSGQCAGCKRIIYFDHMEIDRVIPGDSGPGYVVGNVQLLCSSCNKIKGDRSMEDLMETLKRRGFPRDFKSK